MRSKRSGPSSRTSRKPDDHPRRPIRRRGTAWRIRSAGLADLPVLVIHRRRMWEEIGGRTGRQLDRADPIYRRWAAHEMRGHRFIAFVAESSTGEIGGSGAIWLQPVHPRPGSLSGPRIPYILSMFTEPVARGQHIATKLVREMLRWSRRRGYPIVLLHASGMGRPVYEKLGFVAGREMRLDLKRRASRRNR